MGVGIWGGVEKAVIAGAKGFMKNLDSFGDIASPAAKAAGRGAVSGTKSAAKAIDAFGAGSLSFGGKTVRGAGAVANFVTAEGGRAKVGDIRPVTNILRTATGRPQMEPLYKAAGRLPVSHKALYGGVGAAAAGLAVTKGTVGTLRDISANSGMPSTFLAQHSVDRAYGEKSASPRRHDRTLGDLTLNLGNTSVMNTSIKRPYGPY